jgi:hypothetical protein
VWLGLAACGSDTVGAPRLDACEQATRGSIGCSFRLTPLFRDHPHEDVPDTLIVANPSRDASARVQIVHGGFADEPVVLAPGEVHHFDVRGGPVGDEATGRRNAGAVQLLSDQPISAHVMAPLLNHASNDGSLLLPDAALGDSYVVASYPAMLDPAHPQQHGMPSYFVVIARDDATTLRFYPRADTLGGAGIPAVAAGGEGVVQLDAGDVIHVAGSLLSDLSGTRIEASAPVWVGAGVSCAYVPTESSGYCDHMQEVMRPLRDWSTRYPALPAPDRANEPQVWRVYAGADAVTITTDPPLPGMPVMIDELGDFVELRVANEHAFWVEADAPIQLVQYLAGRNEAAGQGDPSMVTATAPEDWLDRYAISTGLVYSNYYLQLVREPGGAEVFVDGEPVTGWRSAAGLELVDFEVGEGTHRAESEAPFGLTSFGYSSGAKGGKYSSYALPGGLAPRE